VQAFVGSFQEGHLLEKCSLEVQIMHKLFFFRCSFSSGRSLPLDPRTFDKLGFLNFEVEVLGVDTLDTVLWLAELLLDVWEEDVAEEAPVGDLEEEAPDEGPPQGWSSSFHSQYQRSRAWALIWSSLRVVGLLLKMRASLS
jgi:hypothetical protein